MTLPDEQEDDQWLAALAGRPDPAANPWINREAAALRKILKNSAERTNAAHAASMSMRLDEAADRYKSDAQSASGPSPSVFADARPADSQLYLEIIDRLHQERLLGPDRGWLRPQYFALAASLTLAIGLTVRTSLNLPIVTKRGDSSAVIQVVEHPAARLKEILAGLRAAGAVAKVEMRGSNRIRLTVPSTDAVLDYLYEQRLGPMPTEGPIVIILEQSGPSLERIAEPSDSRSKSP